MTRWAVEKWQRTDRYRFKKRMALAEQGYVEKLEAEADRRAVEGIDHPVIYQGVITDTYKQYTDNLLMFRMKKLQPEYRDNYSDTSKQDRPSVTQINIIMPPGVSAPKQSNSVVEGGVRWLPAEDSNSEEEGDDDNLGT